MAIIEECPGFETFGADVKAARKAKRITQRALAETLHVAVKYLADIENVGKIPRPTLYHSCKPRANSLNAPDRSTVGNGTTA